MKIFCAYYTHKPGGFCKRLYRLLTALQNRGHQVTYFTLDNPPVELGSVDVQLIPFPFRTRSGAIFWLVFLTWAPVFLLAKSLMVKPERLIAFNPFYSLLLFPAKILCRAKLILFVRSLVFEINKITKRSLWTRACSNLIDRSGIWCATVVVTMTKSMQQALEMFSKRDLKQMPILPNDIKINSELLNNAKIDNSKFVILTAGVLDQRKNISLALEAFKLLPNDTNFELWVAGSGPIEDLYRSQAKTLGLNNVKFLGWRDDLWLLMQQVQLYLHPSLHEGMSNALLEALAIGLPVLASDIPEHREFLDPRLLFSDASSLAQILINLNQDPQALTNLSKLSDRTRTQLQFDWDDKACSLVN